MRKRKIIEDRLRDALVREIRNRMDAVDKRNEVKGRDEIGLIVFGGVALIGVWLVLSLTVTVPAGAVGVQNVFGSVQDYALKPGLSFKAPWVGVDIMSVKTQELKETTDSPTDEGLTVSLESSILYRLDPEMAATIYQKVGLDYSPVVIEPQYRSIVRGVTSEYDAKSLYTSDREEVSAKIFEQLEPVLKERGIILEKVLLRSVTLPQRVQDGIQAKLVAEQDSQKMQFVLTKETQEAQRKVIEAKGIAESQGIIDNSLTTQYLQWYWISNLQHYSSVIYVPIGDNGMPLFKNVDNVPKKDITTGETIVPIMNTTG